MTVRRVIPGRDGRRDVVVVDWEVESRVEGRDQRKVEAERGLGDRGSPLQLAPEVQVEFSPPGDDFR